MTKEYKAAIAHLHNDVDTNNLTDESAFALAMVVAKLDKKERVTFTEYLWDLNEKELVKLKQDEEDRNITRLKS